MMRNFGSEKRENLTVPQSSFEIFMNSDLSIDSAPNRDMACKIGCGLFLSENHVTPSQMKTYDLVVCG